ncbi:Copper amine oxidase, N-terminal [Phytophthora cactorum]|nr:Copper amine oxidase, N-terminal [Phytophthora cactorum]
MKFVLPARSKARGGKFINVVGSNAAKAAETLVESRRHPMLQRMGVDDISARDSMHVGQYAAMVLNFNTIWIRLYRREASELRRLLRHAGLAMKMRNIICLWGPAEENSTTSTAAAWSARIEGQEHSGNRDRVSHFRICLHPHSSLRNHAAIMAPSAHTPCNDIKHPLDPVTADEVRTVKQVLTEAGTRARAALRIHRRAGTRPNYERHARLRGGRCSPRIVKEVELDPKTDGQIPILDQDYWDGDSICKADPDYVAALAKRGITDLDMVRGEQFSAGVFGYEDEEGNRMIRVLSFLKVEKLMPCMATHRRPRGARRSNEP